VVDVHVRKPKFDGSPDVSDILEYNESRRLRCVKFEDIAMSEDDYQKLPRDRDGNFIGLTHRLVFKRFSRDQLERMTQHDKDYIRAIAEIQMR